jgi:Rrf2 family protein
LPVFYLNYPYGFSEIAWLMFNKETEYALRALVYIQTQNFEKRRPGIAEIAREIDAPQFFTAKILHRLTKSGKLLSLKGKNGGFYFDSTKPDLTLKELITQTEGSKTFEGCGFGLKHCSNDNPCPLHSQYASIRDAINNMLSGESIQSLAKKTVGEVNY